MICGDTKPTDSNEITNNYYEPSEPLGKIPVRSYIRYLRILKDNMKKQQSTILQSIKSLYSIPIQKANPVSPLIHQDKSSEVELQKRATSEIQLLTSESDQIEEKLKAIQSMINFVKNNMHKYDQSICDAYLEKHMVYEAFCVIHQQNNAACVLDMSSIDSFTSNTNLIDISNRDILRQIETHKKVELKGTSTLQNMLLNIDNVDITPSKHMKIVNRSISYDANQYWGVKSRYKNKRCSSARVRKNKGKEKEGGLRRFGKDYYGKEKVKGYGDKGGYISYVHIMYINEFSNNIMK